MKIILYAKAQESKYRNSEEEEKWKDLIVDLIEEQNQLVYFNRASLHVRLTSQERIEEVSNNEMSNYR